jgi:hypothetical protein
MTGAPVAFSGAHSRRRRPALLAPRLSLEGLSEASEVSESLAIEVGARQGRHVAIDAGGSDQGPTTVLDDIEQALGDSLVNLASAFVGEEDLRSRDRDREGPYCENRVGASLKGIDGTDASFVNWYNFGWG